MLWEPWPVSLSLSKCALVVVLGFFLAFGNFAFLAAFAAGGQAAVVSPLGALYPALSVPMAVVFLGERINAREVAAIGLALLSVAALSLRQPAQERIPTL
jgi:drug/metabolite transporter (DMT)-like permease